MVRDANLKKERIKLLIFPTPVGLKRNNLTAKHVFNKLLKLEKIFGDLEFVTQQVDPSEFAIIINKANIIFFMTKRINGGSPNIRKISSKGADGRLDEIEYGSW
jgi:hypothetical protein